MPNEEGIDPRRYSGNRVALGKKLPQVGERLGLGRSQEIGRPLRRLDIRRIELPEFSGDPSAPGDPLKRLRACPSVFGL